MASQLFKNFPTIQYKLNDGRIIHIKDFFRKGKIELQKVNTLIDYEFYQLDEGERPDIVASKLYGDSDLHWVLFLVNEIDNYYDWYMDNSTFNNYLDRKYEGVYLTASSSTDIVGPHNTDGQGNITSDNKFLLGELVTQGTTTGHVLQVDPSNNRLRVTAGDWVADQTITGSLKSSTVQGVVQPRDSISHYINSKGIKSTTPQAGFQSVSIWEMENALNEDKRKIKVIKPQYIKTVVTQYESLLQV